MAQSDYKVLFNWGAGVESSAIIAMWILHPSSRPQDPYTGRPIDLDQLIVLFAITGHEYPTTRDLCELHILPLFRKHSIRLIQAGRRGPSFNDGIVIVDDSTQPYRLYACYEDVAELDLWTLGTELETAAVSIRLSRPHSCAMKFKGWVLDNVIRILEYLARVYGPGNLPPLSSEMLVLLAEEKAHFKQALANLKKAAPKFSGLTELQKLIENLYPGFDSSLITLSPTGKLFAVEPPQRLLFGPVLGYNADEEGRRITSDEYGCRGESYLYPAIENGWSRLNLWAFLWLSFGADWLKSACRFCPFPDETYIINRGKVEPDGLAEAVHREAIALHLNHRMHLYGHHTAYSLAQEHVPDAIELWQQETWAAIKTWKLLRVRRIYREIPAPTDKSPTYWRLDSLRETVVLATGTYTSMLAKLQAIAEQPGWLFESLTQVDMTCRSFRGKSRAIKGMSKDQQKALTLQGQDLRGDPYQAYRVPIDKIDNFKCHPIPRAVHFVRDWLSYPSLEEFVVVVPNFVAPKVRNQKSFEAQWLCLSDSGVNLQRDVLPAPKFFSWEAA